MFLREWTGGKGAPYIGSAHLRGSFIEPTQVKPGPTLPVDVKPRERKTKPGRRSTKNVPGLQ